MSSTSALGEVLRTSTAVAGGAGFAGDSWVPPSGDGTAAAAIGGTAAFGVFGTAGDDGVGRIVFGVCVTVPDGRSFTSGLDGTLDNFGTAGGCAVVAAAAAAATTTVVGCPLFAPSTEI